MRASTAVGDLRRKGFRVMKISRIHTLDVVFRSAKAAICESFAERKTTYNHLMSIVMIALTLTTVSGCHLKQWAHNRFRLGPNYNGTSANVAPNWLEADDPRVLNTPPECRPAAAPTGHQKRRTSHCRAERIDRHRDHRPVSTLFAQRKR